MLLLTCAKLQSPRHISVSSFRQASPDDPERSEVYCVKPRSYFLPAECKPHHDVSGCPLTQPPFRFEIRILLSSSSRQFIRIRYYTEGFRSLFPKEKDKKETTRIYTEHKNATNSKTGGEKATTTAKATLCFFVQKKNKIRKIEKLNCPAHKNKLINFDTPVNLLYKHPAGKEPDRPRQYEEQEPDQRAIPQIQHIAREPAQAQFRHPVKDRVEENVDCDGAGRNE